MDNSQLKIIFAGSVGSGKTTSIRTVSDIEPFLTEENATDETKYIKEKTTVAMDYGRMDLDDRTSVHLYGAPGQGRFKFMWEILSLGALGVIILINNASEKPLNQLDAYMDAFSSHIRTRGIVVGVTCTDKSGAPGLSDYRKFLEKYDCTIPLYSLDARDSDMVRTLIKTLLYRIDPMVA